MKVVVKQKKSNPFIPVLYNCVLCTRPLCIINVWTAVAAARDCRCTNDYRFYWFVKLVFATEYYI